MSSETPPPPSDRPLTKKELRTLKNTLGKQGITMEEHEAAQKLTEPVKILQIDCFALRDDEPNQNLPDADGWYVGYGVAMNGVGRAEDVPEANNVADSESSASEDSVLDFGGDDDDDGSSGFESDPPTDEEEEERAEPEQPQRRRESDDVSDKGQLLYGLDEQFWVNKKLTPVNCTIHYVPEGTKEEFVTGDLITTMRFPNTSTEHTDDDEPHNGYQMIGDGNIPNVTSHSEEESEGEYVNSEDVTTSAGLWLNFVIAPTGFEGVETIPETTIPLDKEKLAQISAAMKGLVLPTPPGWEGISDQKLLDFINKRV